MGKVSTWMLSGTLVLAAMAAVGCDDGPVGKAINCRVICDKFDDCLNVDESECVDTCKDDVGNDAAARCSECLDDDSCSDCASECAGVGIDALFN